MPDTISKPGHHTGSSALASNTLDSVNNSGIPDLQDAQPSHLSRNLSALISGPPSVAIRWWMTLLTPPIPPLNLVVRPKPLPLHREQALLDAVSFVYSDMLRGFSFFVGGGYTSPSR